MNRPSSTSDEQLAVEALQGDQEAFTTLYQQYFDQVYDLASRVLKDSAAAADVAQNVFMKFLGKTEVKPPQVSFRAWLYTMTRNAAIDELRRRQRLVPMAGSEIEDSAFNQVATSAEDNPERVALDNELAALVWEAAQSLNANDYTLLDLNIRKGLEPDELADALGISRGNVYTRLSRLRDSLEDAVTSLILVRRGRQDCPELNELLLGFNSSQGADLTPRSRRAVSRHIAECSICESNRRRHLSATALFGGLAAVLPAAALKSEIWGGLAAAAAGAAAPPPPSPPPSPPPPAPVTTVSEIVKASTQVWSSLGAGVQALVVGMVVAGAIGAAVTTAILVPRFSAGSFPTISLFRLVDPDVGPGGIARHRELHVQVDEGPESGTQSVEWLIGEGSLPQPSPQDSAWASSPPSSYLLSAGDGPKSVDLWLKNQKGKITHAAQFLVLLDTTLPQDPKHALSSSHQIGTPSTNNLVTVQWEPARDPDPGSGIAGYSIEWNQFPNAVPDPILDLDASVVEATSPPLAAGTWYLHLSTLDRAGNHTTTVHVGPFVITSSSLVQAPSGAAGGQSGGASGGSSGGPGGGPGTSSGIEEATPNVDQPQPPQPLEELPAGVLSTAGDVAAVPAVPSDDGSGGQTGNGNGQDSGGNSNTGENDSGNGDGYGDSNGNGSGGDNSGNGNGQDSGGNSNTGGNDSGNGGGSGDSNGNGSGGDNGGNGSGQDSGGNSNTGGNDSGNGGGSGDSGGSDSGGSAGDGGGSNGGGGQSDDDDDDGGSLPILPAPTIPPPGQSSVQMSVTGDALSEVGNNVSYVYAISNDSPSGAPALILGSLTDTLLGNLSTPAIGAGCGTLLPGAHALLRFPGQCSRETRTPWPTR